MGRPQAIFIVCCQFLINGSKIEVFVRYEPFIFVDDRLRIYFQFLIHKHPMSFTAPLVDEEIVAPQLPLNPVQDVSQSMFLLSFYTKNQCRRTSVCILV